MNVTDDINPPSPKASHVINDQPHRHADPTIARCGPGAVRRDQVTISGNAATVGEAAAQIKVMPGVDMDKVARIKARLRGGTYKVDAHKAAANMLVESLLQDR